MIIYLCIKFQFNTPIFTKDIARKPFVLRTGPTDGMDVRTDSGDTICPPPPTPPPRPHIEKGGDITNFHAAEYEMWEWKVYLIKNLHEIKHGKN